MDTVQLLLLSSRLDCEQVEVALLTLTGRSTWITLAVCLPMAALLLAACGSEAPAADTPTAAPQVSTPTAAAAAAEAEQPAATAVPTSPPAQTSVETGHRVGQTAPDFMLTTVDGEEVSLDGFQGQPLVIYFYATW